MLSDLWITIELVEKCVIMSRLQEKHKYSVRWREMVPAASSAVVVIVRGLGKTKWREIIYYHPDNVDRATLEELIIKVGHSAYFNTAVTKQDILKISGVSSQK